MIHSMPDPAPKKPVDHSTVDVFSFRFFCDLCANEWQSEQYPFQPGALTEPVDPAYYQLLWNDQHQAAYDRATREAAFVFNQCPVCGRRVCRTCFHVSEAAPTDLCVHCLKHMASEGGFP